MDLARCDSQTLIQKGEHELLAVKQKMTEKYFGDTLAESPCANKAESPCAKKARVGIPPVWESVSRTLQSPASESICASPTQKTWHPPKTPCTKSKNEQLIAAVASPMRRRSSFGTESLESDQGDLEGKLAVATTLFKEAPPPKKARIGDNASLHSTTPQVNRKDLSTPAGTVSWTPDQRVQLREKIQALLPNVRDSKGVSPRSRKSSASSPGSSRSSRSSSPSTSRSSSRSPARTPERARLFACDSPLQKNKEDGSPPPPPPGSPGLCGSPPPPPPPGSPGCDMFLDTCDYLVPPPPSPDSPSSPEVRRRCIWPTTRSTKPPSALCEIPDVHVETAADIEADIRRLIALQAVSSIFADNIFA